MADRQTPFGKYFLLERINVGGMAEVFKAKTHGVEGFEKVVAIKRILPAVAEDEEFIRMFVDEAKITSQLTHRNLAQTFDLGKIDDTFYIAMEYVPGKDLRAVFERVKRLGERVPLHLAAWVVSRLCEGLDYAHRKRDAGGRELHIVHRDVSPQNIILSYEGEVKLIDFGIAKAANKITRTQAGILKGKFGYMSPEQVRGLSLDRRSDVFGAGVVLWELCANERLFTGSSDFAVLEKVQQARVVPPSQLEPAIPLRLEQIILKALAREPQDRYQHAADLAADLTHFLLETQTRPVTREDLAAFMKDTFPDDVHRESEAASRRPPPGVEEPAHRAAPRLEDVMADRGIDPEPAAPIPERKPPPPPIPEPGTERRAEIIVKSKLGAAAATRADPADDPTRPMSVSELIAAERAFAEEAPKPAGRPAPRPPPPSVPRSPPRPLPAPAPAVPERDARLGDQETQVRPAPPDRLDGTRPDATMPVPPPPPGTAGQPRWMRRAQYAIIAVALAIAAWALVTTPWSGARRSAADEDPAPIPAQETRGVAPGKPRAAAAGGVTVLSSPPDALVYLDGEKKGTTPLVLAPLDPAASHAITLEKKCFRTWQLALPPGAGPRPLAATLQGDPGACPGSYPGPSGMPLPDPPGDAPAMLGFLNLASRPGAQVLIDGVDIGQATPLSAWPLRPGPHKLRLVSRSGSKEVPIEIRGGESHSETIDLSTPRKPSKKAHARR